MLISLYSDKDEHHFRIGVFNLVFLHTPECSGNIDYSTITQNHTETLVTPHISAFLDNSKVCGASERPFHLLAVMSPVCWNKEVVLKITALICLEVCFNAAQDCSRG